MKATTLVLLAAAALTPLEVHATGQPRVDKAATLAARSCQAVTREALSGADVNELAIDGATAAEVWIAGEFVPDLRITLWKADGEATAEVAETPARAGSVCAQLRRIYQSDPGLTQEAVSKRIETRVKRYSQQSHPALASLLEDLRDLRLGTNLSSSLFLPNRSVVLHISNGYEKVRVVFNQPEPLADGVAYSGDPTVSQPQASAWVDRLVGSLGLLKGQ
jgi:hypothetical protein